MFAVLGQVIVAIFIVGFMCGAYVVRLLTHKSPQRRVD